jgi:lipopolysaccharide/colanic/teichoic acid biosynthesis glycosyltransferase
MKRLFDLTISAIALLFLSPLFLLIAACLHTICGGPVFYSGKRVGLRGKVFKMHKFRTMVPDAEQLGGSCTGADDPRITRFGSWLRQVKLDELPQLLNVFLGEMSLVGPRPEVAEFVALFNAEERAILSVRPGITDWASIWDCDEGRVLAGSSNPERIYLERIRPEKIRLQLEYVRRHSFGTDLTILFETVRVLILRPSKNKRKSSRQPSHDR